MSNGRYGTHGGQYVPETLMNAVLELQKAYETYKKDPQFIKELQQLYHTTPIGRVSFTMRNG